jgi:Arc/MetJ-type ribon-helix-helix transcriptional regulator
MNAVRMNITIPEDLAHRLDLLVGPRKKSRFIAEAVKERIERMEHDKLCKVLEDGYKARRGEGLSIARDFDQLTIEGWDEYSKGKDISRRP